MLPPQEVISFSVNRSSVKASSTTDLLSYHRVNITSSAVPLPRQGRCTLPRYQGDVINGECYPASPPSGEMSNLQRFDRGGTVVIMTSFFANPTFVADDQWSPLQGNITEILYSTKKKRLPVILSGVQSTESNTAGAPQAGSMKADINGLLYGLSKPFV